MIKNPITNRLIKINGKTFLSLIEKGYSYDSNKKELVIKKINGVYNRYKNTEKILESKTNFVFNSDNLAIGKIIDEEFYCLNKEDEEFCRTYGFLYDKYVVLNSGRIKLEEKKYVDFLEKEEAHLKIYRENLTKQEIKNICEDRMIDLFLNELRYHNDNPCFFDYYSECKKLSDISYEINILCGKFSIEKIYCSNIVDWQDKNCYQSFITLGKLFQEFQKEPTFKNRKILLNKFLLLLLQILKDIYTKLELEREKKLKFKIYENLQFFEIFKSIKKTVNEYVIEKKLLLDIFSHKYFSHIENSLKPYIEGDTQNQIQLNFENKLLSHFRDNFSLTMECFYSQILDLNSIKTNILNFLKQNDIKDISTEFINQNFEYNEFQYTNLFIYYIDCIKRTKSIKDKFDQCFDFFSFYLEMFYIIKKEIIYNYSDNSNILLQSLKNQLKYFIELKNYINYNKENFKMLTLLEKFSDLEIVDDCENKKCKLCLQNKSIIALIPCGHKYTCVECTGQLITTSKKCPICRENIISFVRVFDD
jgi:hypothetical protein